MDRLPVQILIIIQKMKASGRKSYTKCKLFEYMIMKKSYIVFVAALVAFAACSKEQVLEQAADGVLLTATVEQQEDATTKTSLSGGTNVVWTKGDQIIVSTTSGNYDFTLVGEGGTSSGSFSSAAAEGTPQYAIYPASSFSSISGNTITFSVPAEQTYAANSFGNGANIAVALISGSSIPFKNIGGSLKLQLKSNTAKVGKIVVTDPNNWLSGTFTVDVTGSAPSASYSADGGHTMTLNCPDVQLNDASATVFYIALPVNSLSSDFTVDVYTDKGHKLVTKSVTGKDGKNTINRSEVRAMPEVSCTWLPSDFCELGCVKGTGTQYIDTKYVITSEIVEYMCKFKTSDNIANYSHIFGANTYPDGEGSNKTIPYKGNVYFEGSNLYFYHTYSAVSSFTTSSSINTVYEFDFKLDNNSGKVDLTLNGEAKSQVSYSKQSYSLTGGNSVFLFHNGNNSVVAKGYMYYFKMYDNELLVRDMIPCYNETVCDNAEGESKAIGTVGMYDLVGGKFYTSKLSDEFVTDSEPSVLSASDIQTVEYLEGSGTQYIDTKYVIASEKVEFMCKFGTLSTLPTSHTHVFGANVYPNGTGSNSNQPYKGNVYINSSEGKLCFYHTTGSNYSISLDVESCYVFDFALDNELGKQNLTLNGIVQSEKSYSTFGSDYSLVGGNSLYLFNCNSNSGSLAPIRMYYFKMYDNEVLVRDMVPCTLKKFAFGADGQSKSVGTPGMYDAVTKLFYASETSDAFIAGPAI